MCSWRAQALLGRLATDGILDPVERGDAVERFTGERWLGLLMHVPEFTSGVGQAGRLDYAAITVEPREPGVAISLQSALASARLSIATEFAKLCCNFIF